MRLTFSSNSSPEDRTHTSAHAFYVPLNGQFSVRARGTRSNVVFDIAIAEKRGAGAFRLYWWPHHAFTNDADLVRSSSVLPVDCAVTKCLRWDRHGGRCFTCNAVRRHDSTVCAGVLRRLPCWRFRQQGQIPESDFAGRHARRAGHVEEHIEPVKESNDAAGG